MFVSARDPKKNRDLQFVSIVQDMLCFKLKLERKRRLCADFMSWEENDTFANPTQANLWTS